MSCFADDFIPPSILTHEISATEKVDYGTKEGFLSLFEELVDILEEGLGNKGYKLPVDAIAYLRKMVEYNVPKGKLNRGLTVVHTFKLLKPEASQEDLKRAAVLGWCIEWIQAAFLVSDDVMDASITRRGQPCWYKKPEVGVIAINDALILLAQTELLLHKFFNHDYKKFGALHAVILTTIFQTEMGQNLDLSTQPPDKTKVDLDLYTDERYDKIVEYKTAYYSFYAPVALGMIAADISDSKSLGIAQEICLKMGRYFQIQDDFLDAYADPELLGKIGTDIQDAKCSWLVVQALKTTSSEQREILIKHYGKDNESSIQIVKDLYVELNLEKVYKDFEENIYAELKDDISKCKEIHNDVFLLLLNKIYKRTK